LAFATWLRKDTMSSDRFVNSLNMERLLVACTGAWEGAKIKRFGCHKKR